MLAPDSVLVSLPNKLEPVGQQVVFWAAPRVALSLVALSVALSLSLGRL